MKQTAFAVSTLIALSTAAATPANSQTPVCGSKGYDTKIEGYYWSHEGTYNGCSTACKKEGCVSFSFGNGECNLYHVAVTGNFEPVSDSPYAFYDASCVSSTSTTTSKASTVGTTTTRKSSTSTSTTTSKGSTTSSTTTAKSTTTTKSSTTNKSTTTTSTTKSSTTNKSMTTTTTIKTTARASSSTSSLSTKTSSTTSVAPSPPCPFPTFTVTNFLWFNSSHNARCAASAPDVGDGTGCLDENGNWCDPNLDKNCFHCGIPVCMNGLPNQPVGYGPPDYVKAKVSNIGDCYQQDPGTWPRRSVGGGEAVSCGGDRYTLISFLGDSNTAKSVASFTFAAQHYCPDSKAYYRAYGSGNTSMSCTYDSGRNATCKLDNPSYAVVANMFDSVGYN